MVLDEKNIKLKYPTVQSLINIEDHISNSQNKLKIKLEKIFNIEFERFEKLKIEIKKCLINNEKNQIDSLEKQLKESKNKNKLLYLFDGFKGHRSDLREKIRVAKLNLDNEKKLTELKDQVLKELEILSQEFKEIKRCIEQFKLNDKKINLAYFVAFNFSVDCDYKFLAKETEQESYTEYEDRMKQVPYTKYITKKRRKQMGPNNYTYEEYQEPVTAYRREYYKEPVTKYRTVTRKKEFIQRKLDASELSNSSGFISANSLFDYWEKEVNLFDFKISESELTFNELTNNLLAEFIKENNKLKIQPIFKNKSFSKVFEKFQSSEQSNIISEKLEKLVKESINTFISNSAWDTYSDLSISKKLEEQSKKFLCIPIFIQEFKFYSDKWKQDIILSSNSLLTCSNEFHFSYESLQNRFLYINEILQKNEKSLEEAQILAKPIKKSLNLRPYIISFAGLITFTSFIVGFNKLKINNQNNRNLQECNKGELDLCFEVPKKLKEKITNKEYENKIIRDMISDEIFIPLKQKDIRVIYGLGAPNNGNPIREEVLEQLQKRRIMAAKLVAKKIISNENKKYNFCGKILKSTPGEANTGYTKKGFSWDDPKTFVFHVECQAKLTSYTKEFLVKPIDLDSLNE